MWERNRRITAEVDYSITRVMLRADFGDKASWINMRTVTIPGLTMKLYGPMVAVLLSGENRWVSAQRIEMSGGRAL
jgi:hypothetical protein